MTELMFGMEVELAAGSATLAPILHREGLAAMDRLHHYHCRCDGGCEQTTDRATPWSCQNDSTCDGEFISKPLTWDTSEADSAIEAFAACALEARARSGYEQGGMQTGNHVHISRAPFQETGTERNLVALFARYQTHLIRVACGKNPWVRDYNNGLPESVREEALLGGGDSGQSWRRGSRMSDLARYGVGSYLYGKSYTWEFRLWNSTIAEWRLRLHAGLSVAMGKAALDGVEVSAKSRATFAQVVGPYMTPDTLAYYVRQVRYAEKAGVL